MTDMKALTRGERRQDQPPLGDVIEQFTVRRWVTRSDGDGREQPCSGPRTQGGPMSICVDAHGAAATDESASLSEAQSDRLSRTPLLDRRPPRAYHADPNAPQLVEAPRVPDPSRRASTRPDARAVRAQSAREMCSVSLVQQRLTPTEIVADEF